MPFCESGITRIYYEDVGAGPALLVVPGGGLNASIAFLTEGGPQGAPFNPIKEFQSDYRCITFDMRNSLRGKSTGPLEFDRPWDAFVDDMIELMNHLEIDKFLVMGFCIGGPLIWKLLQREPDRVVAAVLSQPSGIPPESPELFYDGYMANWAPSFCAAHPDVSMEIVGRFLRNMYLNKEFVITVGRDFVRHCETPVLVMPDDVAWHPYAVAMESALLAPHGEVCLYPWNDSPERLVLALRHVRTFLKASLPRM